MLLDNKGGSHTPGTLEGRNRVAKLPFMFIFTLTFKNAYVQSMRPCVNCTGCTPL